MNTLPATATNTSAAAGLLARLLLREPSTSRERSKASTSGKTATSPRIRRCRTSCPTNRPPTLTTRLHSISSARIQQA